MSFLSFYPILGLPFFCVAFSIESGHKREDIVVVPLLPLRDIVPAVSPPRTETLSQKPADIDRLMVFLFF